MADRNVKVVVRADVADFLRGAGLVSKATGDMATGAKKASQEAKTGLSGMAQSVRDNGAAFATVGGALTAYGAAVTGIGAVVLKTGIAYNTLRQTSVAALTTLTGSAENAVKQMDKLDEFASNSPFSRATFIEAQQQLLGFGMEAENVLPTLDAIQNAVAAFGGSNQDISELAFIIAQVGAAGKITGQDLMQFGQRGVDAAGIIGEQMGMTGAQIRESITAGTLDADVAIQALTDGMQQRFGGAAANVKDTFAGAVDRVKAAFRDLSASLASGLVDPTGGGKAVDGLNKLADAMRRFEDMPSGARNTLLTITGLSGAASLAAGGFLLLAPRIVDTWDALKRLNVVGPQTSTHLTNLGRAVGTGGALVAGLLVASEAFSNIERSARTAAPGVQEMARALREMGDSGDTSAVDDLVGKLDIADGKINTYLTSWGPLASLFTSEVNTMGDAFDRIANPNIADRLFDLSSALGLGFSQSEQSAEALASYDAALAQMTTTAEGAEVAQGLLALQLAGSKTSVDEAMLSLPAFRDALAGVEEASDLAAGATSTLADTMIALPEWKSSELDQMREAAASLAGSVGEAATSFINLGESIDDSEVSLDGWIETIIDQANARDAWLENMQTLLSEGLDLALYNALIEQGPAGALRVQQMVDGLADGRDVSEFNELGKRMGDAVVEETATAIGDAQFPTIDLETALDTEAFLADANALTQRAPEEVEAARLRAELELNDEAARAKTAETVLWASEQIGVMDLDADRTLANFEIDQWNALANNTVGMPTLDSDPAKANVQLRTWQRDANSTVATSTLNAQDRPGRYVLGAFAAAINASQGSVTIAARDHLARSTLQGFLNSIPRSVSIALNAVPVVGGLASTMLRLGGGYADGGFTGYGSKYQAAGIVHASEFVHTKENTTKPGMLGFHTDLWRTNDVDAAYARYKMRGYAGGGLVGADLARSYASGGAAQRSFVAPAAASVPPIDYDRLAAAMSRVSFGVSVDGREIARASARGAAQLGGRLNK